jgi:hypothetical protein
MYSHSWKAGKNKYIQAQIKQITKDNPCATGSVPFACIPSLLNDSDKGISSPDTAVPKNLAVSGGLYFRRKMFCALVF